MSDICVLCQPPVFCVVVAWDTHWAKLISRVCMYPEDAWECKGSNLPGKSRKEQSRVGELYIDSCHFSCLASSHKKYFPRVYFHVTFTKKDQKLILRHTLQTFLTLRWSFQKVYSLRIILKDFTSFLLPTPCPCAWVCWTWCQPWNCGSTHNSLC